MAGIRLHHPTLRSCTLVVELEKEWSSRKPRMCPKCEKEHDRKAIHLDLDANGDRIVSQEIYESLLTVHLAGMEYVNEIEKPPTQLIGAVEQPKIHVVENRLSESKNATPFYKPEISKYKSRDKLHARLRDALRKDKTSG